MLLLFAAALLGARCTPLAVSPATATPVPVRTASPTAIPSATEPPIVSPAAPQAVVITTPDGASLTGTLYGAGAAAVIFSPMGDCVGDWAYLAEQAAANGLAALTFQWRACEPGGVDGDLLRQVVDDLRAVVAFVRAGGAGRVILVGASLGGVASARLLAESEAAGLVVVAAPAEVPSLNVSVSAADLAGSAPKLFITAEDDDVVPAGATQALFDLAADPKTWETYLGRAHGTHLFATDNGPAVQQLILAFILQAAGP
jgi:pimeloyl-ACP methyl ester carboxylesterase